MRQVRRYDLVGRLLLVPAMLAVCGHDILWPPLRRGVGLVLAWGPLVRLHHRIGRLPAGVALPLFLVPEACSRLGWVLSAWILLHGHAWRALAVYAATKLVAGSIALWVCSACLPALLRVRVFAAVHAAVVRSQRDLADWARRHTGARFGAAMARVRARSVTPRQSPALASAPTERRP